MIHDKQIHKKILQKYFEQIITGNKTFEFRKVEDGEKYIVGKSNFVLHEIDDEKNMTGRVCRCKITSVISAKELNSVCGDDCIMEGYALIGIRPIEVCQKVKRESVKVKDFFAVTIGVLFCLGVILANSAFVVPNVNVIWSWLSYGLYCFLMYSLVWYLREKKKITQENLNYFIIPAFIVVIGLSLLNIIFWFVLPQNEVGEMLFNIFTALFIILGLLCAINNHFYESNNTQEVNK